VGKQGRTWILIRGLAHEAAHWMKFYDVMRSRMPADNIHRVDLLGTGVHHRETSPLYIEELTQRAREDALKIADPPYFLLSLSMGSMVAYDWERKFSKDVEGLILMNPSFRNFSPFYQRLRWQIYPDLISSTFSRDPVEREKRILRIISQNKEKHEEAAKIRVKIREQRPVTLVNMVRQTIASSLYAAKDGAPEAPTLLLSGAGDHMVDPKCSKEIAKAWKIPHRIHPWAGHNLTLDDPEWVIESILEWLSENDL